MQSSKSSLIESTINAQTKTGASIVDKQKQSNTSTVKQGVNTVAKRASVNNYTSTVSLDLKDSQMPNSKNLRKSMKDKVTPKHSASISKVTMGNFTSHSNQTGLHQKAQSKASLTTDYNQKVSSNSPHSSMSLIFALFFVTVNEDVQHLAALILDIQNLRPQPCLPKKLFDISIKCEPTQGKGANYF